VSPVLREEVHDTEVNGDERVKEAEMMIASGDVLICMENLDEKVHAKDLVTVDEVGSDGEYVTLEGNPGCSYRADAFLVAVRRPWWAWGDEAAWHAEALELAEERLGELDLVDSRNLISETLVARSAAEVAGHAA
jgi:hypothetical protein